jgi:hypothetical protein
LQCDGRYTIRNAGDQLPGAAKNSPWQSEAQGITVEYYRGHPLGCVLATITPIPAEQVTKRWEPIRVGRSLEMTSAETGLLLLKINEPSKDLYDNEGSIEIRIK